MKTIKFMLFAVTVMVAASCVKENPIETQTPAEIVYVQKDFTAGTPTKTAIGQDGESVIWCKGDQVGVFDGVTTAANIFSVYSGVGTTSAGLTGRVAENATEFYAYYPYGKNRKMTDGVIDAYIDETQTPSVGSFTSDGAVMIAKADANGNFAFKNVCSHIKFTLAEDMTDIKAITLMGNNCETLAGYVDIKWIDDEPQIVKYRTPAHPYVTMVKDSGLEPGDYYFSILPVDFTDGFTVILTKKDGTQLAKKTTKRVNLSERNSILPMKALAKKDYQDYTNYFIKYVHGDDVTIGGYTFNKNTHSKYTILSNSKALTIDANDEEGLYFIAPSCPADNAKFKGVSKTSGYTNLMLIGMEKDNRSEVNITGNVFLGNNGSVYMLANLKLNVDYNIVRGNPANFGDIVISNCALNNIAASAPLLMSSDQTSGAVINSIVIEDSELGFKASEGCPLNTGSAMTLGSYTFNNNICYQAEGGSVTKFKLINKSNAAITDVTVVNNTFVDVKSGDASNPAVFMNAASVSGTYTFNNNLLVNNLSNNTCKLVVPNNEVAPGSGSCTNNYYYTTTTNGYYYYIESTYRANLEYSQPEALTQSPLAEGWNPANGVFGSYIITPASGSAPSVLVGAQRAGMSGLPADVNSPSNDYTDNDHGTISEN